MATMTTSAPPAPQQSRTFSFRRSLYFTTTSKPQQRPQISGKNVSQGSSETPAPKQQRPNVRSLPRLQTSNTATSSNEPIAPARTENEWLLTPPERSPPPIPDLHVPKSAPPDVQRHQRAFGASSPTSPRLLGKPRNKEKRGHPHINVTEPPERCDTPQSDRSPTTAPSPVLLNPYPVPKPRTFSTSVVDFARRSFSPVSSRSSSPVRRNSKDDDDDATLSVKSATSTIATTSTRASSVASEDSSPNRNKPALDRLASDSRIVANSPKKLRKGFGSMFLRANSSTPDLQSASTTGSPTKPQSPPPQRKFRDELWEPYRALENDLQRFLSSKADKTIIIRQFLLPFLERWKGRCSKEIAPEDLEKRVRLLHKWWTALLEQARIRSSQFMSGAERPFYMDAMSAIMSRPEWRMAPSSFAPLSAKQSLSSKSASSDSLSSASSGFSIHTAVQHNIKSLYSTAIYDTLAFVIEKMGYRTASPAVVAFGGKVLAYAFFFCNGVPEMLVHLWKLQPALVRKILPEFGVGRSTDMRDISDAIVGEFPEALHCLGFCSFVQMLRLLRQQPKMPVGAPNIDWNGPWLNRWCGRDSDLVFVFFKHYHVLMYEYLPVSPSPAARICAPGYIPVLVQMSTLIDGTIRKQPGQQAETSLTTFEDLLNSSAALPLAPKINMKGVMAENPLVILLHDVLLNNDCVPDCREAFVDSFMRLLRLTVLKTQRYDSNACFQLCDLLEEILQVVTEAERMGRGKHFDWDFWFEVLNSMLAAENNMTELRVISFIYTIWDRLAESEGRKRKWCIEWLISEPVWERFFYHWCPMVRAYFQRLVCWRIARHVGRTSPVDTEIYGRILALLGVGFQSHVKLLEDKRPSSTAPCFPAPSRRLVILKNDPPVSPQGVLLDSIIPKSMVSKVNSTPAPTFNTILQQQGPGTSEEDNYGINKRWSQLRNVFGFKTPTSPPPVENNTTSPKHSKRSSTSSVSSIASDEMPVPPPPPPASFKFSLEWMEHRMMGREQKLVASRLPMAAQDYFDSLSKEGRPTHEELGTISPKYLTYVGRALAEWRLIVLEHESFIKRRREEGRPTDNDVETPTLGVDSSRKF